MNDVPGTSTWVDRTLGPHRPGSVDFNGIGLINDAARMPDPATMPTAGLLNGHSSFAVSVGSVIPNAVVSVTGGAVPVLAFVAACDPSVTTVSSTLNLTRISAGVVWLSWAAGTFPAQVANDKVHLNAVLGAHNYAAGAVRGTVPSGTYAGQAGIQVTTVQDAALTDLSFTLDIM